MTPRDDVSFANMALPAPRNDMKATKPYHRTARVSARYPAFSAALKCAVFDDSGFDDLGRNDFGLDGFSGGLFGVRMNAPLWLSDHLINLRDAPIG